MNETAKQPAPTTSPIEERFAAIGEFHPLAAEAMRVIDGLMDSGSPAVMGWSSGKDSSVLVSLVLTVAVARRKAGLPVPPMLVVHTDTGVESPAVRLLADGELAKMADFARANDLPLQIRVGKPSLYTSWPVRVIGGRALPSFPTGAADCSKDWKVDTGNRLMDEVFADLRKDRTAAQPVVMTGVRLDESATREANIRARGESASEIWTNAKGRLGLSPIIHWSADDVFEYLGYASAGMIETYSDFSETLQFYRDAGGSSCAVVGDMRMTEAAAKQKSGCGARSGCWTCVRVGKDQSAEAMIEADPDRYGFMRPLNLLRNFISNTQYDWDSRNYLGRTIDADGNVAVGADVYSPTMLDRLLRYTLTAQVREQAAARQLGIPPRFTIMGFRELVAIDAQWSMYGIHKPFHALKIFFEVMDGKLSDPPITGPMPRTPVPKYGKVHVGRAWEDDRRTGDPKRDRMLSGGIRSHAHEMFHESCGFETKQLSSGEFTTAWDTEDSFDVDEEGAADFVVLMGEEYIDRYHNDETDRTQAMSTYLSMGIVAPAHASIGRWHAIAQRTQWMQRQGLVGEVQRERLLEILEDQRSHGMGQSVPASAQVALFDEGELVQLDDGTEYAYEEEDEGDRAPAPMG
ncbi:phosphoadenosine phosphosulfate reductase family protein [Variovorax sp. LjRoot290]|uniref:hypothetical protein n=1 Tax=Variovorax sp. LjRoot290 TaxID=3342316 RepID=UPI003ED09331